MAVAEENPLLQSTLPQNTEEQHHLLLGQTCLESKKIWQIAGPSIFSRLALFSMTVITQHFAGHLGELDLAAISIACTFFISISFGFLVKPPSSQPQSLSYCEFLPQFNSGMGV